MPGHTGLNAGLLLVFLSVLNACATAPTTPGGGQSLLLASDGLRAGTTGMEVGFGRAYQNAVASVSRLVSETPVRTATIPCGGGSATAVDYPSGLTLFFDEWAFRGWRASGQAAELYSVASGEQVQSLAGGGLRAGMNCTTG